MFFGFPSPTSEKIVNTVPGKCLSLFFFFLKAVFPGLLVKPQLIWYFKILSCWVLLRRGTPPPLRGMGPPKNWQTENIFQNRFGKFGKFGKFSRFPSSCRNPYPGPGPPPGRGVPDPPIPQLQQRVGNMFLVCNTGWAAFK